MSVPFVDLGWQYRELKQQIDHAVLEIFAQGAFIQGKAVQEFEEAFSHYLGVKHCVTCANGTDALEIVFQAMGIGRGDEVIVPANTFVATAEAVMNVGATPIFCDCEATYFCIDPSKIEALISPRTKAIVPVHLYGQAAALQEIGEIATRRNIPLIEDSAQAQGTTYQGRKVGSVGRAATFSFYPAKNLGAFGDAGAIVTSDTELAQRCRMIANHGGLRKYEHQVVGRNSRLDTIQAAVLNIKLRRLDEWNALRRAAATRYAELLNALPLVIPIARANTQHIYHLFVIQIEQREKIISHLTQRKIATGIHYPDALTALPVFSQMRPPDAQVEVATGLQHHILSLPMFPGITDAHINLVVDALRECVTTHP